MGIASNTTFTLSRPLRWGFWICTIIAIAVVLRRIVAFVIPVLSGPPQLIALDAAFLSHEALTLAHILPALAFVLLAPMVVLRSSERAAPWKRPFFVLGVIVGITAFAMSVFSIGGWTERSAVFFFDALFLFSLSRAYLLWRRGRGLLERKWTLRAVAILLGIATTRPVMGIFFATSRFTLLEPRQFFGIAFWIGFSLNTIAIELWLRSREKSANLRPV